MLGPAPPGSYTMLFKQLLLVVLTILHPQGKQNLVHSSRLLRCGQKGKIPHRKPSGALCPVFVRVVARLAELCPGRGWAPACSTQAQFLLPAPELLKAKKRPRQRQQHQKGGEEKALGGRG